MYNRTVCKLFFCCFRTISVSKETYLSMTCWKESVRNFIPERSAQQERVALKNGLLWSFACCCMGTFSLTLGKVFFCVCGLHDVILISFHIHLWRTVKDGYMLISDLYLFLYQSFITHMGRINFTLCIFFLHKSVDKYSDEIKWVLWMLSFYAYFSFMASFRFIKTSMQCHIFNMQNYI